MLKLYEDINQKFRKVLVIDIIVIAIITILAIVFIKPGIWLALALTVLYAVLLSSILYLINKYEKSATHRFHTTVSKLNSTTDLKGLENELEILANRNIDDKLKSFIKVLLLGVYINRGKIDDAKEIVEKFQPVYYEKEAGELVRVTYLNNITQYYIDKEDLSLAKTYADLFIETIIASNYLNPELKERFKKNYKFKISYIDIIENKEEEYERIENRCLEELKEDISVLEKISYNYILSMIYKKQNKKKKYKECIDFIKSYK